MGKEGAVNDGLDGGVLEQGYVVFHFSLSFFFQF